MFVEINWPSEDTVFTTGEDPCLLASIVTGPGAVAMTVTCFRPDNPEEATTGRFAEVLTLDDKPFWLYYVDLPGLPPHESVLVLRVAWTDGRGEQGKVETRFRAARGSFTADLTGITWPLTGDTIPTSKFVPFGRQDAALLTNGPAPCTAGYPCLTNSQSVLVPYDSGTLAQDPRVLHKWHAVYSTVPAGAGYTLQVKDVNNVGATSRNLTAAP
jgi:hypothetical protein